LALLTPLPISVKISLSAREAFRVLHPPLEFCQHGKALSFLQMALA
jgi:hypothetical protein